MISPAETASCRICTIHLERLCYARAWWFRPLRECFAIGIRLFAICYRIDPRDHEPRSPICLGCIRFRKNALKQRSAIFRGLDGMLNPVFNRVRDHLLTPAEMEAARTLARQAADLTGAAS